MAGWKEYFAFMDGELICLLHNEDSDTYSKVPITGSRERATESLKSVAYEAYRLWRSANDSDEKPENIVLDYALTIHVHGMGNEKVYICPRGAEFFVDEFGQRWVKFTPAEEFNQASLGRETIWLLNDAIDFWIER